MMDKETYDAARKRSKGLFDNALVLPVAWVILTAVKEGAPFVLKDLQEALGGRASAGQIRKALERIESTEATVLLHSPGAPHPDVWERRAHPFWAFAAGWLGRLAEDAVKPEDSRR